MKIITINNKEYSVIAGQGELDKALELLGDTFSQEELDSKILEVRAQEENLQKVQEYKQYLSKTDHKVYTDYDLKDGEILEDIIAKRKEARAFIRSIEG